jgi:alpha-maltose-1-phosphate synthase
MRLLYLHYGPQSGVTASITAALARAGDEVLLANPAERFRYQLRPGLRLPIPNPDPAALRGVAEALRRHGVAWKSYFFHTAFAFDHLTRLAGEAVSRVAPDAVLQAGVLFGPGVYPRVPHHLYVDHTRALAESYSPADGLPPPLPPYPEWRAREQAVYRGATAIFAMSEIVRRSLVHDYGVDPARVHVVGAGPNVEPGPGDLGLAREPRILMVGKNFLAKGGRALLEAFGHVRRRHPATRLDLVCNQAPPVLPEGVTWHGPLGREALARLYAVASALVLPTLREAFGLVLLEAMAFELPVVASRIYAIPEIVADGETGILVPPDDPAALTDALSALLADPARARRMGQAGRARVLGRFGWDRAAARMREVLSPRAAAGSRAAVAAGAAGPLRSA